MSREYSPFEPPSRLGQKIIILIIVLAWLFISHVLYN